MQGKKFFTLSVMLFVGFFAVANAQVAITLPSVPTGMAATIVPPAQVSLSWSAATESSGTIEGYYVYRNGGQFTTTAGTSLIDSGLSSGVYNYTVAAYDESGNVSAQSSAANVTLLLDMTPPSTPSGLTVSGATSTISVYVPTTITISWGASTDNVGVTGYYVYRNGTQIVSSTSAFTGTSFSDTVTPGTYTYSVAAFDAAQNFSNRSTPLSVTVAVDSFPPSTPTNVSIQQISASGANVSWGVSTDNIGVAGYQVFRNGVQIASSTGLSYADAGLSPGVTYTYSVAAYDIAGNVSQRSTPISDTIGLAIGPGIPYALSATLLGTSTVNFVWTPSGDILPITAYSIYRNSAPIASITSTNYLDQGVAPGTYLYTVSATDKSGAVSATSSVSVFIPVVTTSTTPVVVAPIFVLPSGSSVLPPTTATGNTTFTQFLYFGLRSAQVQSMQSLLGQKGYLSSANATGFFGSLTLSALEKFQCDQSIVCTGGAGWGTVGPKTRTALNGLQGGTATTTTSSVSNTSLAEEIQSLEAELAVLEAQASK